MNALIILAFINSIITKRMQAFNKTDNWFLLLLLNHEKTISICYND